MKAEDLLNFKAVSQVLTGTDGNIRKGRIPKKNKEQVKELQAIIDYWIYKWQK